MPSVVINVEATVGTAIPLAEGADAADREPLVMGRGRVPDTVGADGRPVEAVVLMPEPGIPGVAVLSRPVGVFGFATQGTSADRLLCVVDDPAVTDVVDTWDARRWHAYSEAWASALSRLVPESGDGRMSACGSREDAEELLRRAHHSYERLTVDPE